MNIQKLFFVCLIAMSQVAVANDAIKVSGTQNQTGEKVALSDLPESLLTAIFTTSERLQDAKGTFIFEQGFNHSENLFLSVKKSLPELNPVGLYRLLLRTKSALAAGARDQHRHQLNLLLNEINLEMKNRGVVTPELASTSTKIEVTEDLLSMCYVKHPLLQDLTMTISDADFKDVSKSVIRRARVRLDFEGSRQTLSSCYEAIIQFSKAQGDKDSAKHLAHRLSDVRELIYAQNGQAGTKPARVGSAK